MNKATIRALDKKMNRLTALVNDSGEFSRAIKMLESAAKTLEKRDYKGFDDAKKIIQSAISEIERNQNAVGYNFAKQVTHQLNAMLRLMQNPRAFERQIQFAHSIHAYAIPGLNRANK